MSFKLAGHLLNSSGILGPEPPREFDSGATRDQDLEKFDYEGFLSPLAMERFARYMHKNRHMHDGTYRESDNWQKGIPLSSYLKSMWRHLFTVWKRHRGWATVADENLENALCGVIFNAQGMLHELLKANRLTKVEKLSQEPNVKRSG